jgi:hypothetical protein
MRVSDRKIWEAVSNREIHTIATFSQEFLIFTANAAKAKELRESAFWCG